MRGPAGRRVVVAGLGFVVPLDAETEHTHKVVLEVGSRRPEAA